MSESTQLYVDIKDIEEATKKLEEMNELMEKVQRLAKQLDSQIENIDLKNITYSVRSYLH